MSSQDDELKKIQEELKWVTVHADSLNPAPSVMQRVLNKCQENPLVPVGCVLTVGALSNGLVQMVKGNRVKSQLMMRYRVLFQGFTVAVIGIGLAVSVLNDMKKKKENKE